MSDLTRPLSAEEALALPTYGMAYNATDEPMLAGVLVDGVPVRGYLLYLADVLAAAPAVALDVERLAKALEGIGVLDNGTWVSFNRNDAERIAREYAALAETKP